jgi:hypothetical protein
MATAPDNKMANAWSIAEAPDTLPKRAGHPDLNPLPQVNDATGMAGRFH